VNRPFFARAPATTLTPLPGVAQADPAFNVGTVPDYRCRSLRISRLKPASGIDDSRGGPRPACAGRRRRSARAAGS